jgi:hypothetical protein
MRAPAARIGQALRACQQAMESLQASAISGHGGYGILAGQPELPGQNVVFGRNMLLPGPRSHLTHDTPLRPHRYQGINRSVPSQHPRMTRALAQRGSLTSRA